jgi:hypothetical protein
MRVMTARRKDISQQHPELFSRFKTELEKQFTAIMTSGRACRMAIHPVGKNQARQNTCQGIEAKRIVGAFSCNPRQRSITGLAEAGAHAVYAIKVLEDGTYRLMVNGSDLGNAKDCYVEIASRSLKPEDATPEKLTFPPLELRKGKQEFTFGVNGSSGAKKKSRASIKMLRFIQLARR